MEKIKVTSADFCKQYTPAPGWVLLRRDTIDEKYGTLFLPKSVVNKTAEWSGTGVIVAMSPFEPESEHEKYLMTIYKEGDRVGFRGSIPVIAPAPPFYEFENESGERDASITIHIADLICKLEPKEKKK